MQPERSRLEPLVFKQRITMDKLEQFYEIIKKEMTITLATSAGGSVTMRIVSPVFYQGAILIFTANDSKKYRQLKANPRCGIGAGLFFAEAAAEFRGPTLLPENKELRNAYCGKFPKAFDEGVEFGGRDAEFILLRPSRITGWAFDDDIHHANNIPSIPFDISLSNTEDSETSITGINIAPCGLVCSRCDAYRATQENSAEKLELVAASWRKLNSCDAITAEHLSCDGCMNATGRKSYFCANMCGIRHCAIEKKTSVCSKCPEYPCDKLAAFLRSAPEGQAKAMQKLLDTIVEMEQNMRSVF